MEQLSHGVNSLTYLSSQRNRKMKSEMFTLSQLKLLRSAINFAIHYERDFIEHGVLGDNTVAHRSGTLRECESRIKAWQKLGFKITNLIDLYS